MAFLQTIPPADVSGPMREMYEQAQKRFGNVPNWTQAFSLRPGTLDGWTALLRSVQEQSVGPELRAGHARCRPCPQILLLRSRPRQCSGRQGVRCPDGGGHCHRRPRDSARAWRARADGIRREGGLPRGSNQLCGHRGPQVSRLSGRGDLRSGRRRCRPVFLQQAPRRGGGTTGLGVQRSRSGSAARPNRREAS
jgi:hypothetical protein